MSNIKRICAIALSACMVSAAWAQGLNECGEKVNSDGVGLSMAPMAKAPGMTKIPSQSSYPMTPSEPVDLGLSVKWASYNIGAGTPTENGYYFAWGQTQGYPAGHCFYSSDWTNIDGGWSGNPNYDAATANWGSDWRTPTQDEIMELINNCSYSYTTQDGVQGVRFVGRNGNSVFFPAANRCLSSGYDEHYGYALGMYWSDTKTDEQLNYILFNYHPDFTNPNEVLCYFCSVSEVGGQGFSVRAVYAGPDNGQSNGLSNWITVNGPANSYSVDNSGSYPWIVDSSTGVMKSGNQGVHYSTSSFTITIDVPRESTVSFDVYSSSESNYDYMRVYLDGSSLVSQSGTGHSWTPYQYTLSAGTHTLTFTYSKDGSNNTGDDDGCVRNIVFNVPELVTDLSDWITVNGPANNWSVNNNGSYPWVVNTSSGLMQSGNQGVHSSTSSFSINVDVPTESTVSFDVYSSSESNFDYMSVYVDGASQFSQSGTGYGWNTQQYTLSPGEHTLTFAYSKDGSNNTGDDCGYVRHIVFNVPEPVNYDLASAMSCESPVGLTIDNSSSYLWRVVDGTLVSGNQGVHSTDSYFDVQANADGRGITVSFDWYVSSESSCDYLYYEIDGGRHEAISGTGNSWVHVERHIESGQTLRFCYHKDHSVNSGEDCGKVANLTFTPDAVTVQAALELVPTDLYTDRVNLVPVRLINAEGVVATQFDITLPSGLSLDLDDGDYYIVRGDRLDRTHVFNGDMMDGSLRILGYSTANHPYSDNDGDLIYLPVLVDAGVEVGTCFEITLTAARATLESGLQEISVADHSALMTVAQSWIRGDANGDGDVTVTDITYLVSRILGGDPAGFVYAAADANGDGDISVTDISCVVDIILNSGRSSAPQRAPGEGGAPSLLSIPAFEIAAGGTCQMQICIDTPDYDVSALQLRLSLPKGLSVEESFGEPTISLGALASPSHTLASAGAEGEYTLVGYSVDNSPLRGRSGVVAELTLTADASFAGGMVSISDALVAEADGTSHLSAPARTLVGQTSGLAEITDRCPQAEYYSISGMHVTGALTPGIYIEVKGDTARKVSYK